MKKKECPSCAMEIDQDNTVCPICSYEFPERSVWSRWILLVLAILLLILFMLY